MNGEGYSEEEKGIQTHFKSLSRVPEIFLYSYSFSYMIRMKINPQYVNKINSNRNRSEPYYFKFIRRAIFRRIDKIS